MATNNNLMLTPQYICKVTKYSDKENPTNSVIFLYLKSAKNIEKMFIDSITTHHHVMYSIQSTRDRNVKQSFAI